MKISLFGVIWIVLIILCFPSKKRLVALLLTSTVFQASYVMVIGGFDINAMLLTSIFIVIKYISLGIRTITFNKHVKNAIIFSCFLILISIILPLVFSGHEVLGITPDEYNFNRHHIVKINFSLNNLSQPLAILLYSIVLLLTYQDKFSFKFEFVSKCITHIFCLVLFVGFLHIALMYFHAPMDTFKILFHNEIDLRGYSLGDVYAIGNFTKFISTFTEASYCGAYLSVMLAFFIFNPICNYRKVKIFFCLIALICNFSSTGILSTIFVLGLYLIGMIINKRIRKSKVVMIGIISLCFILLLVFVPQIREVLYQYTFGKVLSKSFDLRTKVDSIALQEFVYTYGLGLGMNTIQCYSLYATLISQTGVGGIVLYLIFVGRAFMQIKVKVFKYEYFSFIGIMLGSVIFSQLLSIQALNFCLFWFVMWIEGLYLNKYVNITGEK